MSLIPYRFLVRMTYPCLYWKDMPSEEDDDLVDLPEACRLDNFAAIEDKQNFADVRVAWNELGIGVRVRVTGKQQDLKGDESRPRGSDGFTLWLDTRDARSGHRATRYCHQFYFLPTGGGPDRDEPFFVQTKIHRALQDAPLAPSHAVPFRRELFAGGYELEAFLPAAVLHGFDPEQNCRLGIYYIVRDGELGEQVLSVGAEFPYWEDPSLWSVLELASEMAGRRRKTT